MKKCIFLTIFIIVFIIGIGTSVKAESFVAEISGDKVLMRKTSSDGSTELKAVDIYNLEDYKYFGIRAMAESCGADISWDDSTKTVVIKQNELIISLKNNSADIYINGNKYNFGYPVIIIEDKSYAPLELYKAFTGELEINSSINPVINQNENNAVNGLYIDTGDGSDRIRIIGAASKLKHEFMLINPDRLILDITDIDLTGNYGSGQTFSKIRYFKGYDGITRIVFDLTGKFKYTLNFESNDIVIVISDNGVFSVNQELIEFRNNSVIVNTADYSGYSISRATDPFSIILDIPRKMIDSPFTIDIDGEMVDNISASISEEHTIITIELKQQCAFELEKLNDSFLVGIYKPAVESVVYHNVNDKKYISLEKFNNTNSIISIENKSSENIIIVDDPDSKITAGQIYINDQSINSIFVTRDGNKAIIKVTTKSPKYMKTQVLEGITAIQINDNNYNEFLVVISAGHGGKDPGAIVNGIYESHLNLLIAEKLKKELESYGVNIYMIRTDDTFYALDYRTAKANNLNADLFISIHCNTLEDSSFDGLMTLVHSGKIDYSNINGKTAGTIIHQEVIEATGATDRNVRDRDKIIVLKDTTMPAVEIECGFLTNDAELGKLLEDSYQWSIARGTATGVLKVLDLMN